ncbi:MAG: hypothetical protein A2V67_07015 [Deltaproteobacteria bacterium RBG_13_61_14]|nr:MAG: hypothetical protein A2V67_07015 [Deltaproteobacteria bacterium RBG_13_61_14]
MTKAEKISLLDEINRLEKELIIKKSQLASAGNEKHPLPQPPKRSPREQKQRWDRLIKRIGELSSGGDSVEDQRRERERCK